MLNHPSPHPLQKKWTVITIKTDLWQQYYGTKVTDSRLNQIQQQEHLYWDPSLTKSTWTISSKAHSYSESWVLSSLCYKQDTWGLEMERHFVKRPLVRCTVGWIIGVIPQCIQYPMGTSVSTRLETKIKTMWTITYGIEIKLELPGKNPYNTLNYSVSQNTSWSKLCSETEK